MKLLKKIGRPGFENPARTPVSKPTSHAPTVPRVARRLQVVKWAHWGAAHEPEIHYTEDLTVRAEVLTRRSRLPLSTDCSGFATLCYLLAGCPDPNGYLYKRLGYTGTLLQHGTRIPLERVRPGDLAVYGCRSYPNGHHVAVVVAVRGAAMSLIDTVSHGNERGPYLITVAQEAMYQPDATAGVVFLSFLP